MRAALCVERGSIRGRSHGRGISTGHCNVKTQRNSHIHIPMHMHIPTVPCRPSAQSPSVPQSATDLRAPSSVLTGGRYDGRPRKVAKESGGVFSLPVNTHTRRYLRSVCRISRELVSRYWRSHEVGIWPYDASTGSAVGSEVRSVGWHG